MRHKVEEINSESGRRYTEDVKKEQRAREGELKTIALLNIKWACLLSEFSYVKWIFKTISVELGLENGQ